VSSNQQPIDYVERLATYIRDALRIDPVNHYTVMSPRRLADGSQSMRVKDDRSNRTYKLVIIEEGD